MPTEWTYHADGVSTAVSTEHDLDGSLASVTVELDSFKVREWERDEVNERQENNFHWDEEKEVFVEHAGGAHATMGFDVAHEMDGDELNSPAARLSFITPEDGELVKPRHMALLPAAKRIVEQIDGVVVPGPAIQPFTNEYENAEDVHIERLDGQA